MKLASQHRKTCSKLTGDCSKNYFSDNTDGYDNGNGNVGNGTVGFLVVVMAKGISLSVLTHMLGAYVLHVKHTFHTAKSEHY